MSSYLIASLRRILSALNYFIYSFLLDVFLFFFFFFFFSSRRRHTRCSRDWSSDVCSSDLFAVAGNYWFKHLSDGKFKPVKVGAIGGRIGAGKFIESSKHPQIVIAPGDGSGPLRWYECAGDPLKEDDWVGHDLLDREMIHGHTLDVGDVDGDGHLDIFAAEMAKWTEKRPDSDNPKAQAWIFYGDGRGHFRQTVLATGHGFHEGKLADLDGDGDLDILNKPYTWDAPRIAVWLNNGTGPRKQAGTGASFKGPLGLQLYSLRHHFQKNVPLALDHVRNFGFVEIESVEAIDRIPQSLRYLERVKF